MNHKSKICQFHELTVKKIYWKTLVVDKEETNDFVDYLIKIQKGIG